MAYIGFRIVGYLRMGKHSIRDKGKEKIKGGEDNRRRGEGATGGVYAGKAGEWGPSAVIVIVLKKGLRPLAVHSQRSLDIGQNLIQ